MNSNNQQFKNLCPIYFSHIENNTPIKLLGGKVVEFAFVVNLPDLKGIEKLKGYKTFSLVEFEGE